MSKPSDTKALGQALPDSSREERLDEVLASYLRP